MELRGTVKSIIFNNPDNGYSVVALDTEDGEITAVGSAFVPSVSDEVLLEGDIIFHPKFGEQFAFTSWKNVNPSSKSSIIAYLSSGLLPHIGEKTAQKIYEHFGDAALDILQDEPERFMEIDGIGKKKFAAILEAFNSQREYRNVHMKLVTLDISANMIYKIYKCFGAQAYDVIMSNPYRLFEDVSGIGFEFADRLAAKIGVEKNSQVRIRAGFKYAMLESIARGNCYIPKHELFDRASRILELDANQISHEYDALVFCDDFYIERRSDEDRVYLSAMSKAEVYVARKVYELSNTEYSVDEDVVSRHIALSEERMDMVFGDDQRSAIGKSLNRGFSVITGGPGTGKTTILRAILDIAAQLSLTVMLAAPTGRAAKRMKETTGIDAKTIHRLLEYSHGSEELQFNKNESDPLECDLLVVDEASMIDLILMNALLRAVKPGTRLILIGDADQLPSVGAGNVLKDIIASGVCDCFRLKLIYRQGKQSNIVTNAHLINNGEFPVLNESDSDFFFIREYDPRRVAEIIADLVTKRLPEYYGFNPLTDIQVLSPMKKGEAGVMRLNEILQERLNPKSKDKAEIVRGSCVYRENDRIMQMRNNYDIEYTCVGDGVLEPEGTGIFNGDLGYISAVSEERASLKILVDDEKKYEIIREGLDEITLSYAMTVHKSQGSEFDAVVIPMVFAPPSLASRNLLYTAVTRAKKLAVLVGSEHYLERMIKNAEGEVRYSGLLDRIKAVKLAMGD